MKCRICSDLHLDFDVFHNAPLWLPPALDDDSETTLIIAGDLWTERKFLRNRDMVTGKSWLKTISQQFKAIVFVLGNHDYWQENISYEHEKIRKEMYEQGIDNCYLLENTSVVIDDAKFVGGTLWTDYDRGNPLVKVAAAGTMANDHTRIRYGVDYRKVRSDDLHWMHTRTKQYIFDNAVKDCAGQKVVVVSHMAPSYNSIAMKYTTAYNHDTNYYYYSDLEGDIIDSDISLWVHGHCHDTSDYMIGETRVVCNPRGYSGERTGWDSELVIEV